ncbi:MAG TPA: flagellar assembly protein FliH [Caulobacteraceae bacterium]
MNTVRKFDFDTVFDGEGEVLSSPAPRKAFYTPGEVEQVRQEAYAEGQKAALQQAEVDQAQCLEGIRFAIEKGMSLLAQAAHEHRAGAASLALVAARKIADSALEQFPEAPVRAALEALSVEVHGHPRLLVRTPERLLERIQAVLDQTAQQVGFPGQVTAVADSRLEGAAFVFEWGEGRAAFDPEEAAARVTAALHAALASEGLHAEPLIPAQGIEGIENV